MIATLMVGAALAAQNVTAANEPVRCADDRIVETPERCLEPDPAPGPYMVFFRWGGSVIDRDGAAILDQVVAVLNSQEVPYRLVLRGFSDRSGPAGVNKRIAQERATLVRAQLAARGVPSGSIILEKAGGEEDPLVETADGVREAQNRRVEILFDRID
ncbi:OmpA family protein [Sphingomicrobium astaxanthinifaciens]|uniref:OmpA family protein n=1 Tax=Sphingomicrobium astaxanthinifaciens TaxID=1227949 RepID=UPI001FCBB7E6|nr:OmpA family protein [Sphingomicrobium astaxanthinifaciens]MCJ7420616.1 OmpA family protein [Sphingomicrobium astaxanthinifaciens]